MPRCIFEYAKASTLWSFAYDFDVYWPCNTNLTGTSAMVFLLNPIKSLALAAAAFGAGIAFERLQHSDRCLDASGAVQSGLCAGNTR